jgi:hypothetical protein
MDDREFTLASLLADPMTLAMMAADRVDPVELKAAWTALASKLALSPATAPPLASATECRLVCAEWTDRTW